MNKEEKQEWIDLYLTDQLGAEERQQFSAALQTDEDLELLFEEQKLVFAATNRHFFKQELKTIHQELKKPEKAGFQTRKFYWAVAASLLFFISAGLWFFNKEPTHKKLYSEYFYEDAGLPVVMGSSNSALIEGMQQYKLENYEEARTEWTKNANFDENDTIQYYIAMSYLNEGNASKSIPYLSTVTEKPSAFKDRSYWYLGLIALNNGDIPSAKKYLAKSNSIEAKELLDYLK